jgi:hypothetical protein
MELLLENEYTNYYFLFVRETLFLPFTGIFLAFILAFDLEATGAFASTFLTLGFGLTVFVDAFAGADFLALGCTFTLLTLVFVRCVPRFFVAIYYG